MGAAPSEQNVENPLEVVETPKIDATGDRAGRVSTQVPAQRPRAATALSADTAAKQSTADLELLQSLAAKLKELTEPAAKMSVSVPFRPDSAHVQTPFTAPEPRVAAEPRVAQVPRVASGNTPPMLCTPNGHSNAREGADALADPPALDSSQTVRALTSAELEDGEASRWFAIQLLLSADQIDAAEVPNLDIFREYRLYSVTEPEQGQLLHALRLGFFSSEVAAESVARYLAGYFSAPVIRRISIAERERFADKLVTAGKDIGASGMHAVIELAGMPAPLAEARSTAAPTKGRATPSARDRKRPPRPTNWPWSRRAKSPRD